MASLTSNYIMFPSTDSLDLDEDSGHNFLHSAQSRALLMQKLTRETPGSLGNLYMPLNQPIRQNNEIKEEITSQPSPCILLSNLFTVEDKLKSNTALADLKDEVEG